MIWSFGSQSQVSLHALWTTLTRWQNLFCLSTWQNWTRLFVTRDSEWGSASAIGTAVWGESAAWIVNPTWNLTRNSFLTKLFISIELITLPLKMHFPLSWFPLLWDCEQIGQHCPSGWTTYSSLHGKTGHVFLWQVNCPPWQVHSVQGSKLSVTVWPSSNFIEPLWHEGQDGQQFPLKVLCPAHKGVGHWIWDWVMTPEKQWLTKHEFLVSFNHHWPLANLSWLYWQSWHVLAHMPDLTCIQANKSVTWYKKYHYKTKNKMKWK